MKAIKRDTTAYPRWFDSGAARVWSPELRRAVMKVRPEYFSWPLERRAGYGVAIPKRDAASLDKALLKELFGKSYATRKEAAAAAGMRLVRDDMRGEPATCNRALEITRRHNDITQRHNRTVPEC